MRQDISDPEPERKEIENTLQNAYDEIQKHPNQLPERLYSALEGFSSVLLAWKESKGKPGWSQRLVDLEGKHLFTKEQSRQLESVLKNFEPNLNTFFMKQSGGAGAEEEANFGDLRPSAMFSTSPDFFENVSLDSMFYGLQEKIKDYDEQWKEISDSLGIVKGIESRDVQGFLPLPTPIPYVIPGRAVLPIVSAILDMLRILFTNVFDISTARIVLSLSLTFLDLLRGDWQNALLSLLGAISKRGVLLGFFGKLVHNAWYLIAPDLRRQLTDSAYRSGKSAFIGFWLWAFSTFSPKLILNTVQESLNQVREKVQEFNEYSEDAEKKAMNIAEKAGVRVEFPKIPLTMVPSMDDIQNLQVLARIPEVYCSEDFQKVVKPLMVVPPLRLALELMSIPTVDEQIEIQCKGIQGKSLKNIAVDAVTPKVSLEKSPLELLDPAAALEAAQKKAEETVKELDPGAALDPRKANLPFPLPKQGGKRKTKKRKQQPHRSSSISMPTRR